MPRASNQGRLFLFSLLAGVSTLVSSASASADSSTSALANALVQTASKYVESLVIRWAIIGHSAHEYVHAAQHSPDPQHSLLLHVVDSEGKPVAAAKIQSANLVPTHKIPESESGSSIEAHYNDLFYQPLTSVHGTAWIAIPQDKQEGLAVKVEAEGHLPQEAVWNDGQWNKDPIPREYTFKLLPAKTIGGTAVDDLGQPIEGVKVTLTPSASDGLDEPNHFAWVFNHDQTVRTDAQGHWKCSKLPSRLECFTMKIYQDRYIEQEYDKSALALHREELLAEKFVCKMHKGLVVRGKVTDTEANPLPFAHVSLGTHSFALEEKSTTAEATTDSFGYYCIANCLPGSNTVTVTAKGRQNQHRDIEIKPNLPAVNFQLGKGPVLKVRVVDQDGKPLAGAEVDAFSSLFPTYHRFVDAFKTDSEGRWLLTTLPEGEVSLRIEKRGYGSIHQKITPDNQEHEFVLKPVVRISGQVIDAITKKPIPKVHISSKSYDLDEHDRAFIHPSLHLQQDGHFELTFNDTSAGEGKAWQLRVEAVGYATQLSRKFETEEGSQTITIEMTPGRSLTGVVKRPDGSPVAGAAIFVATASEPVSIGESILFDPDQSSVRTTSAGRFELPLPLEPYVVGVTHSFGGAEITAKELDSRGEIILQPWARVEGALHGVHSAQDEQTDVSLNMNYVKEEYEEQEKRPHVGWYSSVNLDSAGRFVCERVLPGKCRVQPLNGTRGEIEGECFSSWREQIVEVRPGQTLKLEFGGEEGRTVKGHAVLPAEGQKRDFALGFGVFVFQRPLVPIPMELTGTSVQKRESWEKEWLESTAGQAADHVGKNHYFRIQTDGNFTVSGITPGVYKLLIELHEAGKKAEEEGGQIAWLNQEVTIPQNDKSGTDDMDLGRITMNYNSLFRGDMAPEIEFITADGKSHRLSEYRGKKVVLYFTKRWSNPFLGLESREIKENYLEACGGGPVVWINLSSDEHSRPKIKIAEDEELQFVQGFLEPAGDVLQKYDIRHRRWAPEVVIAEDGKVLQK